MKRYLHIFSQGLTIKAAAIAKGVDIINMGIGDPDMPTFSPVVEAMQEAINDPKTHDYPPYTGTLEY